MPELPEVEIVVRDLRAANLAGARIASARVLWNRSIAPGPGHSLKNR
jgi:formamidopyrimidine-DNA glycosylase